MLLNVPPYSSQEIGDLLRDVIARGELNIEIPAGNWSVAGEVRLPAGSRIRGWGRNLTQLRRGDGGPPPFGMVLRVMGDGVEIRDLAIDCRAIGTFYTCIGVDHDTPVADIVIESCRLFTSLQPQFGWTIHGVLLRDCYGASVTNNVLEYAQLKVGATTERRRGMRRVALIGNRGDKCHNGGMSFVTGGAGLESVDCDELVVTGNQFYECTNFGIFVGPDGDTGSAGSVRRAVISSNIVTGGDHCHAVIVRTGALGGDWIVNGNAATGLDSGTLLASGISIKANDSQGHEFAGAIITGNSVRGTSGRGVSAQLEVGTVNISDNVIEDSVDGLQVWKVHPSEPDVGVRAIIEGNMIQTHGAAALHLRCAAPGLLVIEEGVNYCRGYENERLFKLAVPGGSIEHRAVQMRVVEPSPR